MNAISSSPVSSYPSNGAYYGGGVSSGQATTGANYANPATMGQQPNNQQDQGDSFTPMDASQATHHFAEATLGRVRL